jgi:hypothetical protein
MYQWYHWISLVRQDYLAISYIFIFFTIMVRQCHTTLPAKNRRMSHLLRWNHLEIAVTNLFHAPNFFCSSSHR